MLRKTNTIRMIIYFPVSALVTIFANVLQNPQDVRARSDIRLMHQVVSFLSVLAVDEETGGVKRMLEVCQEFERIAKIVLEKADKESSSRRKRKVSKEDDAELATQPRAAPEPPRRATPASQLGTTPKSQPTPTPSTGLTPGYAPNGSSNGDVLGASLAPGPPASSRTSSSHSPNPTSAAPHPFASPIQNPPSVSGDVPSMLPEFVTRPGDWPNPYTEFGDMNQFNGINSPLNAMGGGMQPTFAGQDMWNMPMNFEWDWANMQENAGGGADTVNAGGAAGPFGTAGPVGPMQGGVDATERQRAGQTHGGMP